MKWLPLLAVLLAGCYATSEVPVQAMRALAGRLDEPTLVGGEVLEPGTMVSAVFTDGTRTGWFEADHLRLSAEGLMLGEPGAGTRSAPGVRWSEVGAFQLRSLSPELSALTVPLFPYVLLIGALDQHAFDRMMSSTDGEGEGAPPPRVWSDASTRPLFTGRARRRAIVQALAASDLQATYRGDLSAGLAVGVRFQNFWEFSAVARPLSLAGVDVNGGRVNVMAFGGAMGLHIEPLPGARFAFYMGVEVAGTDKPVPVTSAQLKWGPRVRLNHGLFLTVSPLNCATYAVRGTKAAWNLDRVVTSIELGGTL
jgi:hypothetical protein